MNTFCSFSKGLLLEAQTVKKHILGALKQKLVKAGGGFKFKCEFIGVLKIPQRRFMSCLDEQHICIKTKKQSYEI